LSPGKPATFTATVRLTVPGSLAPTGNVTFKDGGTTLDTVKLNTVNGIATAVLANKRFRVGQISVTAVYSGDASCASSTSTTIEVSVK
jgi:hypothetical protein